MTRYALNTDTDRTWCELCDTREPHVNGVGTPVARVADETLARQILDALHPYTGHVANDLARAAFNLGEVIGILHKHHAANPAYVDDLLAQALARLQAVQAAVKGNAHG